VSKFEFRFDLILSVCALLISTVAAGTSAYQTFVVRQQFSATVWPYLTFQALESTEQLQLTLHNAGIGPALIRSVRVTRDGTPYRDTPRKTALQEALRPEIDAAIAERNRSHQPFPMYFSSVGRGDVIPADGSIKLLDAQGSFISNLLNASQGHIGISVCYCSLLGQCWTLSLHDSASEPHAVSACPDAA
jgi:hypothetical protein